MDFLWFRSGLALSKRFLGSSPAGHIGHEHGGKNYHQQANNDPRKLPHSPLCFAFFHNTSSHWSRRGVWRDDLCILPTSPGTKRTMFIEPSARLLPEQRTRGTRPRWLLNQGFSLAPRQQ